MSVKIEHSQNGCCPSNPTASRGGMWAYFISYNETNFHSNNIIVLNVTFTENCAQFSGGLYFYFDCKIHAKESNTFSVDKWRFEGNRAHTGSAVDITLNVFERLTSGTLMVPYGWQKQNSLSELATVARLGCIFIGTSLPAWPTLHFILVIQTISS